MIYNVYLVFVSIDGKAEQACEFVGMQLLLMQ